ncbi:hypothetical protein BM221_008904 [Beauveria bassiana]|uniref:Aminoglycoside phosphotransferase domain-containing protein n=1 Tax=Beauveria bassiana TaxID=176275 RepID=A0A2N6NE89_BEABA|nr:hypothetical protein BM221_008904 [Beauveria bassiana]
MTGDVELQDVNTMAINNTPMRRFLTLLALKTLSRFYKWDGPCVPISSSLIVKKGSDIHLTEAATMAFVAARTKIPVPRSYLKQMLSASFCNYEAFHEWLREGLGPEVKPPFVDDDEWTDIKYMIAMQEQEWAMPVFTHGDLNPFNIMVRDGNIEAIIDWEFSGWYPRYWEYTSVWLGNKTRIAWQRMAEKFIDPWPNELRMETIRQKWWGDF